MNREFQAAIAQALQDNQRMVSALLFDAGVTAAIARAATACVDCLRAGGKILLAGNGGSAADAQHIAGELMGRFAIDRPALPAIALSTDTSVLTAVANDHGFETVFARQIQGLGIAGDVFIAYSTSGRSANMLRALGEARSRGLVCIGITGAAGVTMAPLCDHLLVAPATETPRIQEAHLLFGHLLCGLVEQALFGSLSSRETT